MNEELSDIMDACEKIQALHTSQSKRSVNVAYDCTACILRCAASRQKRGNPMKYIVNKADVFSNKSGMIPVGEEVEVANPKLAAKWMEQGVITSKKPKTASKSKAKTEDKPDEAPE